MLYLKKLLQENNVTIARLTRALNLPPTTIRMRLCYRTHRTDFTIKMLEDIKAYLVKQNIIPDNFDIGQFLEEVE